MQFSFKRPNTSKSVSALYRDNKDAKSIPKTTESILRPLKVETVDPNVRWKQAAQKINRQMVLHRALQTNTQPFRMLSKMGGQIFASQPKLNHSQSGSKMRVRITSKEKRVQERKDRQGVKTQQALKLLQSGIGDTKLKRRKRNEQFGLGLQQELKTANIFYESPVIKIGFNMQFQSYLRFQHIDQIRPDHGGNICRNSIIFFLKDAPFSPNIISEKNTEIPIALSLFPQFFDSKLSLSSIKRKSYLQNLLQQMNSTYDPERMAALPRFSSYPAFNDLKYRELTQNLMSSCQKNYKSQWLENILKILRIKPNQYILKQILSEQWEFFNQAISMITLDYVLKNPQMSNKLKVSPYLPTRVITAKRILYHGGYCKSIYTSWSQYVQNGRKRLSNKLKKYNQTTQAIHGWYSHFQNIQLFEKDFPHLLPQTISVRLFSKIQHAKINYAVSILQNLWFRGVLCLFHYKHFLIKKENEYQGLINYQQFLSQYIKKAQNRILQLKNREEIQQFYENFYENFLKSLRKQSNASDLMDLKEAGGDERPQMSSIKILLHIQLNRTVEKSFLSLWKNILNYEKPFLRLHLVIDRQSFKFLQQQEEIVGLFAQIIKKILGVQLSGYALACRFENSKQQKDIIVKRDNNQFGSNISQTIIEYPQIYETVERNSLQQDQQLVINYKTEFIFDEKIRQIINNVRQFYKQCFAVLIEYEMYLPFIKLTTTQKMFSEDQGSVQQSFLKNIKIVSRYKQSINKLQKLVRVNLFEVDCSAPIRALQQRIRQIQYIIQQNYLNIIHQKIEIVDSELNSLKIIAHNIGIVSSDIEQTEEKLLNVKHSLKMLHSRTKKIAEMVMFCIDNRRKVETVVTCFCQLVAKKQELHRDIDHLFANLQAKRPEVEAENEQHLQQLLKGIQATLKQAGQVETTCFEFNNLLQYIKSLQILLVDFDSLNSQISKHVQYFRHHSKHQLQDKFNHFRRQTERFTLMIQYWKQFYSFQAYFKEISKIQTRSIVFSEYDQLSTNSGLMIEKMYNQQQEWWNKDKIGWKPIIHRMHEYYSKKLKTDVEVCIQLKPVIKILTNRKIRERHWQIYGLQAYRCIPFRELIKLNVGEDEERMLKMDREVNFQYEIFLAYEAIEKQIKSYRLLIVDLNDSDILDIQNLEKCVQFLRNVEIDINQLTEKDVGEYYDIQLKDLLVLSHSTVAKLEQWKIIEEKYIKFIKFHMNNDEYELTLFSSLIELHRKLIKSYDIDNSVAFISKNIVMDSYLTQISEELKQLETRVTRFLVSLRTEYPRLYLLNDEQLFDFMSHEANIQKYLNKCFPQILSFGINEGSIQRVGLIKELALAEPYYIQQMIGRVNTWVSNLEDLIKCRMKQFFKTNQILSQGKSKVQLQIHFFQKYPVQLAILDEQIAFTEQISEAVATGNLTPLQQQIQNRIESFAKQKKEHFKLLLLILFREEIACLAKEQDLHSQSFQWLKFPRFYRKSQLDVRVCFVNHENIYGFNYLQKNQLIYTTNVFMGNCLIGPEGCGKTAFVRNLSYLCGQQLITFDPRSISHSESTINSLINHFRVSSFVGNWLFLQRIDLLGESQLKLIAQCISSVQQSIKIQANKISLSGHSTPLNRNVKFLMSCRNLYQSCFPGRLCVSIRPIWINYPNKNYLLEIYLQSKRVNSIQVGKILKFCCWLQNHKEPSLQILDWIRSQQDIELFSSTQFFQKACLYDLYHRQAQQLLQIFRAEEKPIQQIDLASENLEERITSNRSLIIYGEKSSGKTFEIMSNLKQGTYLIINALDYYSDQQFFSLIRSIKYFEQFPYLILKHSLQYYSLIKQVLGNYKVIFVESSLSHIDQGMINCIDFYNFNNYLTMKEGEETILQGIIGKILKDENQEIKTLFNKKTIFIKCIEKLIENLNARSNINQIYFNFAKIFKIMIREQYEICVSFLFAIFWTFSFQLDEKRLEQTLKTTISTEQQLYKTKFQKFNPLQNRASQGRTSFLKKMQQSLIQISKQTLNNRITPLIQLIPLKKGKFVTNLQLIGQGSSQQICLLPKQSVCMKSNFIFNLSIIRKKYPSTIVIEGRDWLTSLLKITNPPTNQRFYNFGSQEPIKVFEEIFKGFKKKGIFYKIPCQSRIVIDDIHLCSIQTLNCLKSFGQYGFSSFISSSSIKLYQTSQMFLTFGSKNSHKFFQKALNIIVQQNTITTIYNEYIQSYCQKYMTIDRSIFSLLNLANNINRTYYDQEGKYYWFKNPLILLQSAKVPNLTQYIQNYIDYLCQILPMEKSYFNSQRLLLQLPTEFVDKETQQPSDVINTTSKFKIFYNETQIIEELISDHEVLQQIQSRRVESIFFEKFIRKYFTKEILSYVRKVSNVLQFHHLILLGDNSSHVQKILRYACKISGRKLLPFRNQKSNESRTVFAIYLQHCKEKQLLQLQNILKLKKSETEYDKVRFVLTGCLNSQKVKKIFSQFPFLKSYFLNLVLRDKEGKLNSTAQIFHTESTKTIEDYETDCLERLQALQPSKNFQDRFKDEFIKVYENYHKDQLINLEFYRKVSSQMMVNIDLLGKNLQQIPVTSDKLTERQLQILSKKSKNATLTLQLKEKLDRWQQKKHIFSELFYYKHERELDNLAKLKQVTTSLFNKMEKAEKKIQGLETVEFARLKNNLKNNENNALVFPFHSILFYLHDKNDTILKDKIGPFANNIFTSSSALATVLKNVHSKQNYDKQGNEKDSHNNSLISTGMSVARLKYFLSKAEEIQQNGKKYEKVSLIYKILSSWFSYFHQVCINLKEYLDRQDQKDSYIVARLTAIHEKYGENQDIHSQKQNLHVSVTESQNKIKEINEVLQDIQHFNNEADLEIKKIAKLKKFLSNRAQRLGKLYNLFAESEYMKLVSSSVSLYFKHIENITFQKALIKTTYNEFMHDRIFDPDVLLGIFTSPTHLLNFQQRMEIQNISLIQLKIIHNLVELSDKPFKLVEDRDSLIKQKLIQTAQKKGFIVESFQHVDYQDIFKILKNKVAYYPKILLLHENVYYLELGRKESEYSFHEFIEEVRSLIKQKQVEIIYVTNYLPSVDPDFFNYLQMGKVVVTKEKFMSDLSDIFNVTLQKEEKKQIKQKRGELGVLIKERNSIIKNIMSTIDKLTTTLSQLTLTEQKSSEQIERQQTYSQQLQNYLINLITLQQQCQALKLENVNYAYLPYTVRDLIQQQLRKYYCLYKYTDNYNNETNNQFFSGKDFYRQWTVLMKNLREERLTYFNKTQFRQVISEITVKNQSEDRREEVKIKNEDNEGIQVNQSINPIFHKYNNEIFSFLVEKIVKTAVWLEKSFVYQYVLGVALMQALEFNGKLDLFHDICNIKVESKEQINQQCVRVLKLFEVECYRGYEFRFDKLSSIFIDNLQDKGQPIEAGCETIVLLYYYLTSKLNQYEPKIQEFINSICNSLISSNHRTAFEAKYQLFKCLRGLKLVSQNVLKLTPPLNLSINIDSKMDRQKMITIIQEEKYFLNDLVELLKIKSLSKKRDFETIMIDMNKKGELIQTLKNLYRSSKQWVLLSNFSLSDRGIVRKLLDEILCELSRLPHNSFFRIFIILNKEEETQKSLYYNKYQINRIKGSHSLSDIQYYEAVNHVAIQQLFQGGKARQLVEQLIISTLHEEDDYSIAVARLEDLRDIYSKFARKYCFIRQDDYKIYYKNIVQDLTRLGYFKKDHNQRNFYQYITNYFIFVSGMNVGVVSRQIQDNRQLQKQGICDNLLMQNARIDQNQEKNNKIERINMQKIQEYFKNINSEFVQALRKQIIINNQIQADQQFLQSISASKKISEPIKKQYDRIFHMKHNFARRGKFSGNSLSNKIPLIRLMKNLKLKQICNTKKVDIHSSSDFWIFLTAFQYREVRQFTKTLMLSRVQNQTRYSSGIGLFGNFLNTRDYATRLKVVLVDEENFQEIPILEEEITKALVSNGKVEGRFIIGIRKTAPQKITELNVEYWQIEKILKKYIMIFQIGGDLVLELVLK